VAATITVVIRYPIEGFTPESIAEAELIAGAAFPGDRPFVG
jgi:uncharacterized protein YcbX